MKTSTRAANLGRAEKSVWGRADPDPAREIILGIVNLNNERDRMMMKFDETMSEDISRPFFVDNQHVDGKDD